MNGIDLFNSITGIDDDLIDRSTRGKSRYCLPTFAAVATTIIAIAVCVAVLLPTSLGGGVHSVTPELEDNTTTDQFFVIESTEGVADWYSPGQLEADLLTLKVKRLDVKSVSASEQSHAKTAITGELPIWVYGADMLNQRFLRLYAYDDQAKEAGFGGYLVYDIEKAVMVDLTSLIYSYFIGNVHIDDLDDEPEQIISIVSFSEAGEYFVFDYIHTEYIPSESGETMIPFNANERYIINVDSGIVYRIPVRDILAVSNDGRRIVNCAEIDGEFAVFIYETATGSETRIPINYRGYTVFGEDGKSIIFYAPQTVAGEDSGWDTVNASWMVYDTTTGIVNGGKGRIVHFTRDGDAVVVRDSSGGRVFRLCDMGDVTGEYELETYEKYEIEKRLDNGVYSFFAVPLFEGEEIKIVDHVESWTEWDDYYYFRHYDSSLITVYSIKDNGVFECDISSIDIPRNYDGISIYVTEEGKKCRIVTYIDLSGTI